MRPAICAAPPRTRSPLARRVGSAPCASPRSSSRRRLPSAGSSVSQKFSSATANRSPSSGSASAAQSSAARTLWRSGKTSSWRSAPSRTASTERFAASDTARYCSACPRRMSAASPERSRSSAASSRIVSSIAKRPLSRGYEALSISDSRSSRAAPATASAASASSRPGRPRGGGRARVRPARAGRSSTRSSRAACAAARARRAPRRRGSEPLVEPCEQVRRGAPDPCRGELDREREAVEPSDDRAIRDAAPRTRSRRCGARSPEQVDRRPSASGGERRTRARRGCEAARGSSPARVRLGRATAARRPSAPPPATCSKLSSTSSMRLSPACSARSTDAPRTLGSREQDVGVADAARRRTTCRDDGHDELGCHFDREAGLAGPPAPVTVTSRASSERSSADSSPSSAARPNKGTTGRQIELFSVYSGGNARARAGTAAPAPRCPSAGARRDRAGVRPPGGVRGRRETSDLAAVAGRHDPRARWTSRPT